ncbi:hypothetical protein NW752_001587 [Fusarium irregulare]|uniref:Heterokaryon incompatibility domain-containing protein n=1 Tax=Fusarium irregulare TaxID=2494466 RepID=A0A9W8UC59_9HYPO|nr:hypothetical protein NW766_003747 [Fusarium irregulare]KAJ4026633.1 hypothetical protein NW752_001587 [Fusarium irregulare]
MSTADRDAQAQPGTSDAGSKHLLYQPLDSQLEEFRILQVLPGSEGDPIRCTLHTTPLTEKSDYEALSYNWGDPQVCRVIEVDGMAKDVTVNLFNALRRLRLAKEGRRIWVDALCINQTDDIEKSHQVNLMSKIYSWTKRALLWIGDFSGDKDAGPNAIPGESAKLAFDLVKYLADDKHYNPVDGGGNESLTAEYFEALADLVLLPWWNRAWTVQEAILPKDAIMICGSAELSFERFVEAYDNSFHHDYSGCCHVGHRLLLDFWLTFNGLRETRRNHNKLVTATEVVNILRTRGASDPRDKIYAYLGLIGGGASADYALPVEEAFQHISRALIEKLGTLDILLRVSEKSRSPSLPTWVPDWAASVDQADLAQEIEWIYSYAMFRAAGQTKAETRDSLSNDALDLEGFIIDRAAEVGTILETGSDMTETVTFWQRNPNRVYPQGGTYSEAAWHCITTDIHQSFGRRSRIKSDEDPQALFTEALARDGKGFHLSSRGCRGFVTEKGIIGVGHPDMVAGDSICIFKGGNMPFIVRQVQRDEGIVAFQYIGQAYVYKMMDGEMINESTGWDWITLV